MSFDTTSTHDLASASTQGNATSAPGKRSQTSGLSAPQRQPPEQQLAGAASASSSPTSLHGTGWLAGVLGFGGGDSSGGERDEHDHHDAKHGKKHHSKHHREHAEPITGGGEGATARAIGESDHDDDHEKHHDKHHHKKKHRHAHAEPITGGGEGVAQHEAGEATGRPAPPGSGPEAMPNKAAQLTISHHTAHEAPDGSGRTRTTVGVGEVVHFTGSKSGTWSASGGPIKKGGGKSFQWEAMERPGTATITLRNGNQVATTTLHVIAPNMLHMVKYKEDHWPKGVQGAGMWTNVTIGPSSVSFGNVEWLEVPGGPSNITGYFAKHDHLNHQPNPQWLGWNVKNAGLYDHASLYRWPKPWSKGSFQWVIPNKYRVNGKGSGEVFIHTHQVFHLEANGSTLITKGGAEVRRTP